MADLSVSYAGLNLKNPIIAGASGLTANMDTIRRIEDAGVGALVTKSLFEEEIQLDRYRFDDDAEKYANRHAEMVSVFPDLEHAGPDEHLMWVRKTTEAVDIPVIGSLNAVNRDTWLEYARLLAETGVDALECNLFATPKDPGRDGADVEQEQVDLVRELKAALDIPVTVKLSPFYTNPLNVIQRLVEAGADGIVLFNRLFEPDLDVDSMEHRSPINFSHRTAYRLPLRYTGLLAGEVNASLCAGTGILDGTTVVKMILAGADAVQVVTTLYRNGIDHVGNMLEDMTEWMEDKGYASPNEFRGKLSNRNSSNPWVYTRAQYARLLMQPEKVIGNRPVP